MTKKLMSTAPAMLLLGLAASPAALAQAAPPPAAATSLEEALTKGKLILDVRARFESVDQELIANNANAATLRTRFGFETAPLHGFKLLVEAEDVRALSDGNFNDTINGKTLYPVVADPSDTEINRAQLSWSGPRGTSVILGRQRIILDNARFVGNAGFRQNEQTFDALTIKSSLGVKGLALTYSYIDNVNRIFSDRSPQGRFLSDSHLFNASYEFAPALKLTGYAYLLELDARTKAPSTVSTQTYGVRAEGKYKAGAATLGYVGEYATQSDYADNPRAISNDYWMLEGSVGWKGLTLAAGHENLDGDGTTGFSTPLATLFAFNGWADVFLNTPARGLTDTYVRAAYVWTKVPALDTIRTQFWYHDYGAAFGAGDYGKEWNAMVQVAPNKRWTIEARFADYSSGSLGFADRSKFWLSVGYVY